MRVVLDTNILISALLIQVIVLAIPRAWQEGAFALVVCAEQLDELVSSPWQAGIAARINPTMPAA